MDVSREGLGGRVPEREWGVVVCCLAERGSKAPGSKYLPRTVVPVLLMAWCGRHAGACATGVTGTMQSSSYAGWNLVGD